VAALTVEERARETGAVLLDVDGTLTDGGIYYSAAGEELKKFNVRDGQGIASLRAAGIPVALVTREGGPIVERRARKLGVELLQQVEDKLAAVEGLLERWDLSLQHACFVGDDLGDLAVMQRVGFAVAVADAAARVRETAHHVTERPGGEGAVRELCDLLLAARGVEPALGPHPGSADARLAR
jgi:3-deoxy-D-manno-octulosonate 8-phosphate phosphatase (KDO 8-P phosphatase)